MLVHGLITLWVAAEPSGPGNADLAVFAQYGVLGVLAILLIWFAKGAYQRERDRSDRLEQENKHLNELVLERVIPALTSATHAIQESAQLLNALQREREYKRLLEQRDVRGGDL